MTATTSRQRSAESRTDGTVPSPRSAPPSGRIVVSLIGTRRRARQLGITVRLVAPSLPVRKVLSSTGLDRSFTICLSAAA